MDRKGPSRTDREGQGPAPHRRKSSSQGSGEGPAPHRPDVQSSSRTPPRSPANSSAEEKVERDLSELLAGVERERDEYLELARRTKADFENYRKRVAGEGREGEKRGRAALARDLVPALDNLDRALAAAEGEDSSLAEGVRLVREEIVSVLRRSGVESYEPAGERFDPHLHEAMMTRAAGDSNAGKVLEVLQKGYRLDGEVLRPARVVVGAEGSIQEG